MSFSRAASSSILNRSPFMAVVRSDATLSRRFSVADRKKAEAYVDSLSSRGIKVRLVRLGTSFQLRMRRIAHLDGGDPEGSVGPFGWHADTDVNRQHFPVAAADLLVADGVPDRHRPKCLRRNFSRLIVQN